MNKQASESDFTHGGVFCKREKWGRVEKAVNYPSVSGSLGLYSISHTITTIICIVHFS